MQKRHFDALSAAVRNIKRDCASRHVPSHELTDDQLDVIVDYLADVCQRFDDGGFSRTEFKAACKR